MIVNAHGFKKIALAYKKAKETLSVGEFLYINWPNRLHIDVHRRDESATDLTIYSARKSDVKAIVDAIKGVYDAN